MMEMQYCIEDAGHRVIGDVASTIQLGRLPASADPDLVLIDLNLAEGTNGLDACRMVRERWSDAFIVFVTANPSKIPQDFHGSHGVITKPFSHRGFELALQYLSLGICTPPPDVIMPTSFMAFGNFEASWQ